MLAQFCLAAGLLLLVAPAQAGWRVLRVIDGDTLVLVETLGERVWLRIEGIDAPEKGQPFADRSRQSLQALLRGCRPEISVHKHDRFGRQVGQLQCDGRDIGLAQIEAGMAWHFARYAHEQSAADRMRYSGAQADARRQRRGLWHDREPIAPWLHRARPR